MHAGRHHIVHEVIARRYRVKDPGNPLGLLAGRDFFKAKMGGVWSVISHSRILIVGTRGTLYAGSLDAPAAASRSR